MPHRQNHRGAHPDDARLFGPAALPKLRRAAEEVRWLVGRGYAKPAAVEWVGGHHQLEARARMALQRAVCSDEERRARQARERPAPSARGALLRVDGFNLIITVEVALSGGLILVGDDGALRDLAGLRGSYHPVEETDRALALIGEGLLAIGPARAEVLLDAPVSNSGRLRQRILEAGWSCAVAVELVPNADLVLRGQPLVVTSDAALLDACESWLNLAAWVVADLPDVWRLSLGAA
jgi:hypothetical protein